MRVCIVVFVCLFVCVLNYVMMCLFCNLQFHFSTCKSPNLEPLPQAGWWATRHDDGTIYFPDASPSPVAPRDEITL